MSGALQAVWANQRSFVPPVTAGLLVWGSGGNGRLGLGNQTSYSSPTQLGSDTWLSVATATTAAGAGFTVAVRSNNTLWSWGDNQHGQLGLGNITSYSSPKQVGALTNWLQVTAGTYGSVLAVKTDGTLWGWGINTIGQLGFGNRTSYSSPKQVGALTGWSKVSAGLQFTLSIKTAGTLWSWGSNDFGQLGSSTITSRSSPVQVGALTIWSLLVTGNYTVGSIRTNGTLWTWGGGNFGMLGSGANTMRSSPVQVGALTNWSKLGNNFGSM